MKRLLIAPLFLSLLVGCSPENNKIVKGEWISHEKITGKQYNIGVLLFYRFLGCIGDVCQYEYKFNGEWVTGEERIKIVNVYCDTLEVQQIGTKDVNLILPRVPLKFNSDKSKFALMICEQS